MPATPAKLPKFTNQLVWRVWRPLCIIGGETPPSLAQPSTHQTLRYWKRFRCVATANLQTDDVDLQVAKKTRWFAASAGAFSWSAAGYVQDLFQVALA